MQSRNWMFTINNPTQDDEPRNWAGVKYLVFQLERAPTTGTLHFQGYVIWERKKRKGGCIAINSRASWEPRYGSHDKAREYCMKLETRVSGPWEKGDPPAPGKRNDLEALRQALVDGHNERHIALDEDLFGVYLRHFRGFQLFLVFNRLLTLCFSY